MIKNYKGVAGTVVPVPVAAATHAHHTVRATPYARENEER